MRTDRKKDLDTYYNDHLKLHIMRRLMLVDTWSEIKGTQSAVYDVIKGAELLEDGKTMQKGLTWFQKYFTDQYYTLLD